MEKTKTFRAVDESCVPLVIDLISRRMKWMDRVGISHWNVENYFGFYTPEYFYKAASEGALFGFFEDENMICAATLWESDSPWDDDLPSLYIHNLASDESVPGCGKAMLTAIETYARGLGKSALRLDAAAHNISLNNYYLKQGFVHVGTTEIEEYKGNKLEKRI